MGQGSVGDGGGWAKALLRMDAVGESGRGAAGSARSCRFSGWPVCFLGLLQQSDPSSLAGAAPLRALEEGVLPSPHLPSRVTNSSQHPLTGSWCLPWCLPPLSQDHLPSVCLCSHPCWKGAGHPSSLRPCVTWSTSTTPCFQTHDSHRLQMDVCLGKEDPCQPCVVRLAEVQQCKLRRDSVVPAPAMHQLKCNPSCVDRVEGHRSKRRYGLNN